MPLAMRTLRETPPAPPGMSGLIVRRIDDPGTMATLQKRPEADMRRRMEAGHRAYVAFLYDEPAAFGWVATRSAEIGELGSTFTIAAGERYLWNFVTLAAFRGRGVYPALIEHILRLESADAERYWIAWAPENHASGSGIRKAGFAPVAELSFDAGGTPAVRSMVAGGGALAAHFLGVVEARAELAQCWKCVRAGRTGHHCRPAECRCDYQRPEIDCHA